MVLVCDPFGPPYLINMCVFMQVWSLYDQYLKLLQARTVTILLHMGAQTLLMQTCGENHTVHNSRLHLTFQCQNASWSDSSQMQCFSHPALTLFQRPEWLQSRTGIWRSAPTSVFIWRWEKDTVNMLINVFICRWEKNTVNMLTLPKCMTVGGKWDQGPKQYHSVIRS